MASESFSSKLGGVLAAAGSAVGLGNIWRFPTETGENGGAAFLIIYLGCMLFIGVPIMVSEFVIGRHSQTSVAESFYRMSGGSKIWKKMGFLPVISGFLVLSYYAVIAGWTLFYAFEAGTGGFAGKDSTQIGQDFQSFSSDPFQPMFWMILVLVINCIIVAMVFVPSSSGNCPCSSGFRNTPFHPRLSVGVKCSSLLRIWLCPMCLPVKRQHLDGDDSGAAVYMSVKRSPWDARASMLRVSIFSCP